MKLTLYLYKEYNDELAYGEEYTELIVKKSDAEARLKERVKKAYQGMSLEEMREDPMFIDDTLDDDYVSIQNDGDDVSSFVIEEKSVELSEEEARQLAAKLNAFLEHRAEEPGNCSEKKV